MIKKTTKTFFFATILIGMGLNTVQAESRIVAFGKKIVTSAQSRWNRIKEDEKKAWGKLTEEQKKSMEKQKKILVTAAKCFNIMIPFIYFLGKYTSRRIGFYQLDNYENTLEPLQLNKEEQQRMNSLFETCGFKQDEIKIREINLEDWNYAVTCGESLGTKNHNVIILPKWQVAPLTKEKVKAMLNHIKGHMASDTASSSAKPTETNQSQPESVMIVDFEKGCEFITAHELGHIHYKHSQKKTTALLVAPLISTAILETYSFLTKIVFDKIIKRFAKKKETRLYKTLQGLKKTNSFLASCFVTKIVLSWLLYYAYSRSCEKQADLFAADKIGVSPVTLMDNSILGLGNNTNGLFDEHPKRSTRIGYLKAFQATQNS